MAQQSNNTGFKELLNTMMTRRWNITLLVLLTFMGTVFGIGAAIVAQSEINEQWKELLLLLLGAFIGSYGKIIDYWFSDTDKDKMLVQKMDEEDGVSLSNTAGGDAPILPPPIPPTSSAPIKIEIDEDGDGIMDGYDTDGDGDIDEYFAHRQCEHVWGDSDNDGELECLKCGLLKAKFDEEN